MKTIPKTTELFDLSHSNAEDLLKKTEYPYEALSCLRDYVISLTGELGGDFTEIAEGVFAHSSASVSPSAVLFGPTVIHEGAEIRAGAFIRGSVIIGKGAVIGNSTELKNTIIFDCAQLPHYNYAGDSIIGYKAHMGAGVIASNLRLDRAIIKIRGKGKTIDTGMKKLGVMLGDNAEVGCGSVLSPGTVIGRGTLIYPLSDVRGVIPENSIFDKGIRRREE